MEIIVEVDVEIRRVDRIKKPIEIDSSIFIDYLDWPISDKEELRQSIIDCVDGSEEFRDYMTQYEDANDWFNVAVSNIDILVEKYSHLIKKVECCKNKSGNYCSECGKKL